MSQSELDNRFPDCVLMKLHSAPVQLEEPLSSIVTNVTNTLQAVPTGLIELKLTIRFGKHKQEIKELGSSVSFGLKRGELKLYLEDGKIPQEKMGLTAQFATDIELEVQQEKGSEMEAHLAASGGAKIKGTSKTSTKAKYKTCQFYTKGTEEEPVWVFEAMTEAQILWGQLTEEKLGVVELTTKSRCVKATFEVQGQSDLYLFDSKGLLQAKNLSVNKTALLARELFLRFIEPKLQPYLSRVKVQL